MTDLAERMAAAGNRFRAGCGERAADLRSALAAGDAERIERIAHKLAGAAGLFGFRAVTEQASKLEHRAADGMSTALRQATEMFCGELEDLARG